MHNAGIQCFARFPNISFHLRQRTPRHQGSYFGAIKKAQKVFRSQQHIGQHLHQSHESHRAMELLCRIQNYDWGARGEASKVVQLHRGANPSFQVQADKPYAELWMGTHPNGPSCIKETNKLLSDVIDENPEGILGKQVTSSFGNTLPYLFKVLSVAQPLSIQAHPNKQHAELLFATKPDIYKDKNHKPELAIALGPFKAMCGFRPVDDIKFFIQHLPQLVDIFGQKTCDEISNFDNTNHGCCAPHLLKLCFTALLNTSRSDIAVHIKSITNDFKTSDKRTELQIDLLETISKIHGHDPGCLAIYLMNVIDLTKGQSFFIGANIPHAYLLGDCVEIMACSDNVIRAGLTPKFIDKETLVGMLDYNPKPVPSLLSELKKEDNFTKIIRPPVQDFAICQIEIPMNTKSYTLIKRSSASILIVIEGSAVISGGQKISMGQIFFYPCDECLTIESVTSDIVIYQAMTNI